MNKDYCRECNKVLGDEKFPVYVDGKYPYHRNCFETVRAKRIKVSGIFLESIPENQPKD